MPQHATGRSTLNQTVINSSMAITQFSLRKLSVPQLGNAVVWMHLLQTYMYTTYHSYYQSGCARE